MNRCVQENVVDPMKDSGEPLLRGLKVVRLDQDSKSLKAEPGGRMQKASTLKCWLFEGEGITCP